MIKIIVKRLRPEGMIIDGDEPSDILDIEENENIKCIDKIHYKLHASLVNNGILVRGEVYATLECRCGFCLKKYIFELKNDDICHFYEKPDKNELDLTDDIREDILLSFPLNLKCSEKCKGLCLKCGQNLNFGNCSCSDSTPKNLWNELDQLKF